MFDAPARVEPAPDRPPASPYADWFEAYAEDRHRGQFKGAGGIRLTGRPGVPGRLTRPDRTTAPRASRERRLGVLLGDKEG